MLVVSEQSPRPRSHDLEVIRANVVADERALDSTGTSHALCMANVTVAQARALLDVIDTQRQWLADLAVSRLGGVSDP